MRRGRRGPCGGDAGDGGFGFGWCCCCCLRASLLLHCMRRLDWCHGSLGIGCASIGLGLGERLLGAGSRCCGLMMGLRRAGNVESPCQSLRRDSVGHRFSFGFVVLMLIARMIQCIFPFR